MPLNPYNPLYAYAIINAMKGARGGYTIVEVIIALAVSTLIFFAAMTVFAGRQGKTEFAQGMRDIESRVSSAVNDVRVSTYPDTSSYDCTLGVDADDSTAKQRPKLVSRSSGTSEQGTNTDCIFLGKTVLFDTNNSSPDLIKVYTVLGNRKDPASGGVITTFDQVNPQPILNNPDITEEFNVPFGIKVRSASVDSRSGNGSNTYMLGFYHSLQSSTPTSQGSQSLKTVAYANQSKYNGAGQVKTAIWGLGSATKVEDFNIWTICLQSGTSNEFAQLIVNASFSGVTSQVKYVTSCT